MKKVQQTKATKKSPTVANDPGNSSAKAKSKATAPDLDVVTKLSAYAVQEDGPLTEKGLAEVRKLAASVVREMPHASPSEHAAEVVRRLNAPAAEQREYHDAEWIANEMRRLLGWMVHNIETLHEGDVATSEVNNLREQVCRMLALVLDVESLRSPKAVTP